jgi:hypothetical protein
MVEVGFELLIIIVLNAVVVACAAIEHESRANSPTS